MVTACHAFHFHGRNLRKTKKSANLGKLVYPKTPWISWGVKTTCLEAPGVSLGGSGVFIGGSLRVIPLPELRGFLGVFPY